MQSQLAFAGGRLAKEEWFVDVQVWCQRIARRHSGFCRYIELLRLTMLVFNRWSVFSFFAGCVCADYYSRGGAKGDVDSMLALHVIQSLESF